MVAQKSNFMCFAVYGQRIQSDFDLSPCAQLRSGPCTVKIAKIPHSFLNTQKHFRLFHELRFNNRKIYARFYQNKKYYYVHYPNQGEFWIDRKGKNAFYRFSTSLDKKSALVLTTHHCLPLALSLQGNLVLHAASLLIGKEAQLICGPAGTGKSSIAAYMHRQSFKVLSDDACLLRKKGNSFYTCLSLPIIRIWQGQGKTAKKKWLQTAEKNPLAWYKISRVYFPKIKPGSKTVLLSSLDASQELLPQLFRLDFSAKAQKRELLTLIELCKVLSFFEISYSHDRKSLNFIQTSLESRKGAS